ncbi:MAG: SDR family oxidoreductase [Acidobacteria bacterium]|nr:SDR family oxidoreductase [Acidobacteriota bacterium]
MAVVKGKICVVTGGSRGIGAAVSRALAKEGATVVVTHGHSAERAAAVVDEIIAAGGEAEALHLDVTDAAHLQERVDGIIRSHHNVDVWVNNAGVSLSALLLGSDPAQWNDLIETNLKGTIHCVRAVAKYMIMQKRGSIINISSLTAQHPFRGQSVYAATKSGVEGFTRAMAVELARKNVRVNAVAPGWIETEMTAPWTCAFGEEIRARIPMGRTGSPEDVADAVLFLASDWSRYVTGQVITVDGGMSI